MAADDADSGAAEAERLYELGDYLASAKDTSELCQWRPVSPISSKGLQLIGKRCGHLKELYLITVIRMAAKSRWMQETLKCGPGLRDIDLCTDEYVEICGPSNLDVKNCFEIIGIVTLYLAQFSLNLRQGNIQHDYYYHCVLQMNFFFLI